MHYRHLFSLLLLATLATPTSAQRMRIGSANPTGLRSGAYTDAYFAAGEGTNGVEVWYHSGSTTALFADVYPGPFSSYPTEFTRRSAGNLWFVARGWISGDVGRELHYYPAAPSTTGGTVIDIDTTPGVGSEPQGLTLSNGMLFFSADDGINGRELWVSTGATASMVKDIMPGSSGSNPFGIVAFGNGVMFAATDATGGTELWKSDGSALGTVRVADIRPGTKSSLPTELTVFGRDVYFAATTDTAGRELWKSDGTTVGTVQVIDLQSGTGSSCPQQLTAGPGLAFTAWTSTTQRQLWVLSGSTPAQMSSFTNGDIAEITASATRFWFRAQTAAAGHELWRTNGSTVQLVHDLQSGTGSSWPRNLQPFGNDGLLFRADDGSSGDELWKTDGTTATLVADIRTGVCSSRPTRLAALGASGTFLFAAKAHNQGIELWKTDGSSTSLALDIDAAPPLPQMHIGMSPTALTLSVKDGAPSRNGVMVFAPQMGTMFTAPFLRGAAMVNLTGPTILLRFTLNAAGQFQLALPPLAAVDFRIGAQAVTENASNPSILDMSTVFSCVAQTTDITGVGKVHGEICLDDESGEYTMKATRLDTLPHALHIGLYFRRPNGYLEKITDRTLHGPGESTEGAGNIENLLQLYPSELPGKVIEMHMFKDGSDTGGAPATPPPPSSASKIVESYC
ncbi:MAG: hypothetical protein KDC87_06225 [Planctomycetes bacterium]|nr:hypothetical protein [Planctomycetota bacterium]